MRFLNPLVLFAAIFLFSFPSFAQQTAPTGKAKIQQKLAIAGEWSEPVNGIRMMVKYLQEDTLGNEIRLLVFLQNSSAEPIKVPSLNSDRTVFFKNHKANHKTNGNLRVTVEPLGDQKISVIQELKSFTAMQRLEAPVEPGEIRLHAICLKSEQELHSMMHKNLSAIRTDSVDWESLNDPNSKGRWRISLSYRPDEQFPVKGSDDLKRERHQVEVPNQWRDVQIDLPSIELDWEPQGSSEEPQAQQQMKHSQRE